MKQIRPEDLIKCLEKLRQGFSKEHYPDFYVEMKDDRIEFYIWDKGNCSFPCAVILLNSLTDFRGQDICSCMIMFTKWKISTEPIE